MADTREEESKEIFVQIGQLTNFHTEQIKHIYYTWDKAVSVFDQITLFPTMLQNNVTKC